VKLIKRFTSNLILLYDGDAAGIKAALRGLDIVLEEGLNVKVVLLPDNEDPDSFARNSGAQATLDYIAQKQEDFVFFKSKILLKDAGNDPVLKSHAIRSLIETIALVQDNIRLTYYVRECAQLAELPENILIQEVNKVKVSKFKDKRRENNQPNEPVEDMLEIPPAEKQTLAPVNPPLFQQEKDLIRILFEHGHKNFSDGSPIIDYIIDEVGGVDFKNDPFYKTLHAYIERFDEGYSVEKLLDIQTYNDEIIQNVLIDVLSSPYSLSENWEKKGISVKFGEEVKDEDVRSAVRRYVFRRLLEHLRDIDLQIKEAQQSNQSEKTFDLLKTKKILIAEKNKISAELGTTIFK
jgi:DNA primase